MTDHTALALLRDAESYLSALHGSVALHDVLAANLGCAGCELRDKIRAALETPAKPAAVSAVVSPPTSRAAVLLWAAKHLDSLPLSGVEAGVRAALTGELRRLADEAQPAQCETPDYTDGPCHCPSCDPASHRGDPPADRAALRARIAEALIRWSYRGQDPDPETGILETVRANAYSRTDAVLAVLPEQADRAAEFDEMENARRSFPNGVKPALCKALAAADRRNIDRIPGEDRERYAKQADAVLRLMGWRESQLTGQYQDTLKALRAAEAELRRLAVEAHSTRTQQPTAPTSRLSVQHSDALWDAIAVPGPDRPPYPVQHERVCRAVADIVDEVTAGPGARPAIEAGCSLCGHRACMGRGRCGVVMTSEAGIVHPPCQCLGAPAGQQPAAATGYGDGKGRTYCLACASKVGANVPLTADDVDHWELCPSCGRHVIDVARTIERQAAAADDEAQQDGGQP